MAPPVVGRRINLTALRPITSEKLLATYFEKGQSLEAPLAAAISKPISLFVAQSRVYVCVCVFRIPTNFHKREFRNMTAKLSTRKNLIVNVFVLLNRKNNVS